MNLVNKRILSAYFQMIALNYDEKILEVTQAGDMISHDRDIDRSHAPLPRYLYVYVKYPGECTIYYRIISFSVRSLPSTPLLSSRDPHPAGNQAELHAKYQTRPAMS